MIADKIVLEVIIDKATNERLKKIVGFEATRNVDLAMAIARLLDLHEEAKEQPDNVNHPSHYTQGGIECIDAIRASMTAEEFAGFLKGNAMKYLWRYRHKGKAAEDLKKARWYIDRLIESVEGEKE